MPGEIVGSLQTVKWLCGIATFYSSVGDPVSLANRVIMTNDFILKLGLKSLLLLLNSSLRLNLKEIKKTGKIMCAYPAFKKLIFYTYLIINVWFYILVK